ncbi:hypothetical protein SRABI27_02958 [Pedobacter sp. Bi27]|nr:hypothetical protein SRABI36_00422 [Pedobacter sp. Bi36]CAH0191680.1 hypothetical protein SRABI126_01516 [Pedobacter sp. Bi126]CAH0250857.1 hypothetical protein SRABI27_02958 [Pedobacter sp. Bi27]
MKSKNRSASQTLLIIANKYNLPTVTIRVYNNRNHLLFPVTDIAQSQP